MLPGCACVVCHSIPFNRSVRVDRMGGKRYPARRHRHRTRTRITRRIYPVTSLLFEPSWIHQTAPVTSLLRWQVPRSEPWVGANRAVEGHGAARLMPFAGAAAAVVRAVLVLALVVVLLQALTPPPPRPVAAGWDRGGPHDVPPGVGNCPDG